MAEDASRWEWFPRLLKYAYLLVFVAVMSNIAYNAFSYYIARRDIDAELREKKGASLEFLLQQGRRRRELALTSLSGRCTERMELALFRILDAESAGVDVAYRDLVAAKNKMVNIADKDGKGLIDPGAVEKMNLESFTLVDNEKYLQPLHEALRDTDDYKRFRGRIDAARDNYARTAEKYRDLVATFDKRAKEKISPDDAYWNMNAVSSLAKLNEQTRAELKDQKDKLGDFDDVLSRYVVWTDALAGGISALPLLDDTAYLADESQLGAAKCKEFRRYYEAVNGELPNYDTKAAVGLLGQAGDAISYFRDAYNHFLLTFFRQPPSAQTLFVTLLLGAIGATTLNLLRMSKVGWWSKNDDPLWGEITVAPFLGALAAFAIFLVGSSGLLLTSDAASNQPLSGYFIGLLGFLSGLVYDEAFGRVRRVGSQIFSTTVDLAVVTARPEDRSLAQLLRANGADMAADLVLLHGYGTTLGPGLAFTLLIPSDETMVKMTLGDWRRLNDLGDSAKQAFLDRHCANSVLRSADAAAQATLTVRDRKVYAVKLENDVFSIGGAQVIHRDLVWNKGVVHVLAGEPAV